MDIDPSPYPQFKVQKVWKPNVFRPHLVAKPHLKLFIGDIHPILYEFRHFSAEMFYSIKGFFSGVHWGLTTRYSVLCIHCINLLNKKTKAKSQVKNTVDLRVAGEGLRTVQGWDKCNKKQIQIVFLPCDRTSTFGAVNKAPFDSRSSVLTLHIGQSRLFLTNLSNDLELGATKTVPIISTFKENTRDHMVATLGTLWHFWHSLLPEVFRFTRTQEIKLEGFPPTYLSE